MTTSSIKEKYNWDEYIDLYGPDAGEIRFRLKCIKNEYDDAEAYGEVGSLLNLIDSHDIHKLIIGVEYKCFCETNGMEFDKGSEYTIKAIIEAYKYLISNGKI